MDTRIHFEPGFGLILKRKVDDQSSVFSLDDQTSISICSTLGHSCHSSFSTSTTVVRESSDGDGILEATYQISVAIILEGNLFMEQDNAIVHALRKLECWDRQPRPKNWRQAACMF